MHQFTFPLTVYEGFLFFTPSPAFIVCRLSDDDYSDWYEITAHHSFMFLPGGSMVKNPSAVQGTQETWV